MKKDTKANKKKQNEHKRVNEILNILKTDIKDEDIIIPLDPKKQIFNKEKLKNPDSKKETLDLANKSWKHYKSKYMRSYGLYIGLHLLIVLISTTMIILNLYALRWNTSEEKHLIWFFIAIAIGSLIITLLTSVNSFMSFAARNYTYKNNIEILKVKLDQYKNEPIDDLHSFITDIGNIDTDL